MKRETIEKVKELLKKYAKKDRDAVIKVLEAELTPEERHYKVPIEKYKYLYSKVPIEKYKYLYSNTHPYKY